MDASFLSFSLLLVEMGFAGSRDDCLGEGVAVEEAVGSDVLWRGVRELDTEMKIHRERESKN